MSDYNPFSLKNKTILVTGASSGVGVGIAIECSKMGADMIITGRNQVRLNQTFTQLQAKNNNQIIADLTKNEDIDFIVNELPLLDGVVFNAGMVKTTPVKNITESGMLETFQTNILSSILLVQRMLKYKKIKNNGSIVFISSISTFHVKAGNSLYSATKGAVNSFSKVLALELVSKKIRVNCIQPGFIRTNVLDSGAITDEQLVEYEKTFPLGFGEPIDVAFACIYLLSDVSKWATGSVLTIDGGATLR